MNRKFATFILLCATIFSLSSCLENDTEEVEYTHDTAITAFSLGTLTRNYHSVTTAGNDTTLTEEVTGSDYKFYIDQVSRQIYNPDSLPTGTVTSAVLTTITSKNSGPVVWMDIETGDTLKAYYSSSDSIDLSKPRKLRVYNNDYSAYATYTLTVNVHQEEADSFAWRSLAAEEGKLAALSDLKAVECNQQMFVFGITNNSLKIYSSSINDGKSWTEVTPGVALSNNAYKSVVTLGDYIYVLDNGQVLKSSDVQSWTSVCSDLSLIQLIGASKKYLYAYTTTGIAVSKDEGATWQTETLDMDMTYLPTENVNLQSTSILSTKNAENMVLLGNRSSEYGDSVGTVWTKTLDYADNAGTQAWNFVEYNATKAYKAPLLSEFTVEKSDSGLVALGSNGKWYRCKDGGITWTVDTTVVMPTEFVPSNKYAFTRDSNKFYWVINTGTGSVWKGRYNRDGWRKDQNVFTE